MGGASNGDGEDSEDLETALANLEAGRIETPAIDVLLQTITFQVRTNWVERKSMSPSSRMSPRFTRFWAPTGNDLRGSSNDP